MEWSGTLIKIGTLLSERCVFCGDNVDEDNGSLLSIGICLPRVDYAAALLSAGICSTRITKGPPLGYWDAFLPNLVGKTVAFSLTGAENYFYSGFLVGWRPSTFEVNFILSTPRIYAGETFTCQSGQLAHIKEEAGAIGGACESPELYLHEPAALRNAITVAGSLSRLSGELLSSLGDICVPNTESCLLRQYIAQVKAQNGADICVGRFIRANCSQSNVSPIYTNVKSVRSNISDWSRFSIIEASSRLFDHARTARGKCRIILFGRNEPGYLNALQTFNQEVSAGRPVTNQITDELNGLPPQMYIKAFSN
jgi:hypothetical protein